MRLVGKVAARQHGKQSQINKAEKSHRCVNEVQN